MHVIYFKKIFYENEQISPKTGKILKHKYSTVYLLL